MSNFFGRLKSDRRKLLSFLIVLTIVLNIGLYVVLQDDFTLPFSSETKISQEDGTNLLDISSIAAPTDEELSAGTENNDELLKSPELVSVFQSQIDSIEPLYLSNTQLTTQQYLELGQAYLHSGRADEAIDVFNIGLGNFEQTGFLYELIGDSYAKQNKNNEAILNYTSSITGYENELYGDNADRSPIIAVETKIKKLKGE